MRGAVPALLAGLVILGGGAPATASPNIVVVMTDDQDEASVRVMDDLQRRIAGQGVTYENAIATFPLCCPSRATFLTGQYAHNHGVLSNGGPAGGDEAFEHPETALSLALDHAGYRTGLIGKYLNGYSVEDPIPPGWDSWQVVVGAPSSYDYDLDENGRIVHYGSAPEDYHTRVYANKAVRWIERAHGLNEPFFLTVATGAPHSEPGGSPGPPPLPGPSYQGRFDDEPLPRPPNFDEKDVFDKPAFVRKTPRLTAAEEATITARYRARLASLLPVDSLVGHLVGALHETGELGSTYIIFTSDNGSLMGAHRLHGKTRLYEESVSVPLMIRGPDLPRSRTRSRLVGNIDVAPTILDMANAEPGVEQDGQSLLKACGCGSLLLEAWPSPRQEIMETSKGVRTQDYAYIEHDTGESELYDLNTDSFQLQSLHDDPAYDAVEAALEARLRTLEDCAGSNCGRGVTELGLESEP
jgi:arylsulfatase A-like enzyme